MATFAYSGRTRQGQTVSGERIAETMDGAVAALRREQILVTQISPVKEAAAKAAAKPGGKKVKSKSLAVFTRQFSVMIDAGLPLVQCLELSLIHISEPTRQAEISYAVFCLKKKKKKT